MRWLELSVRVPSEFVEPISYLFNRYGRGFSIEDEGGTHAVLRTYVTSNAKQRLAHIDVGVKLVGALIPIEPLQILELDGIDWQDRWKEHFTILRIGHRLVVKPPWLEYTAEPRDLVIELDPGMAFGTGHHPTTRLCLEELEHCLTPDDSVLDLGVGSGILSIASARLGANTVMGLDLDPMAVKIARRSCKFNGVGDAVKAYTGTLPQSCAGPDSFDLAVVNISAKAVLGNINELETCLKPGGVLIASGFLQEQVREFLLGLVDTGLTLQASRHLDDWAALVFKKGE